jgi:hypothetical protein
LAPPNQKPCKHLSPPHACHMSRSSHPPWSDHPNNIRIHINITSYLFFKHFWLNFLCILYTGVHVHTRPVSPGFVQQIMPNVYNKLDTWMVICLTATT